MTNSILISELFNQQDKIFIESVYLKNYELLTNLGNYIKENNLSTIPYEKDDLKHLIFKSLYQLRNVTPDSINRFGYACILKKIFIQQLINVSRKFSTHKEKILSVACANCFIDHKYQDNFLVNNYSCTYDANKIYGTIIENLKKSSDKKIFNLYLNNVKPRKIAKLVNKPIKQIYNTIFLIKNQYHKSLQDW